MSADAAAPGQGMDQPLIRVFEPGDQPAVIALVLPIQQDEFGVEITAEEQPDLIDIANYFQAAGGNFWVAEADGALVGTIGLKPFNAHSVALKKMFVDRAWRGGGLAAGLLDAALDWARVAGFRDVYLGTTDKMIAAHCFYEKYGFHRVEKARLPDDFILVHVDDAFFMRAL